jgi:hypothetical protein
MTFATRRFAFAVALAWAVWYAICAFFVTVAPEQAQAVFSYALHYELPGNRLMTWSSFFGGLILSTAWIAVFGATIGWFFNARRRPGILESAAPLGARGI